MALRLLQILVPGAASPDLERLLEGRQTLGMWRDDSTEGLLSVHLVVLTEEVESIVDRFSVAYGNTKGFHIVSLPVEALVPREENGKKQSPGPEGSATRQVGADLESARMSREELYNDIADSLGADRVFVAMALLAAIVAAVGLIRNDVVAIIGAMVIAPLLGPNVGMALATTLGDLDLLRRALLSNLAGIALTLVVSLAVGLLVRFDPAGQEIASRTEPSIGHLVLALAAGVAGTLAFTRGLASAVVGVMVAVALVPPLVTFGMLLGAGYYSSALRALLLFAANLVSINLAGVATFLVQGVRPRNWWEEERAKRASRVALLLWLMLLAALVAILYAARIKTVLVG